MYTIRIMLFVMHNFWIIKQANNNRDRYDLRVLQTSRFYTWAVQ